MKVLVLGLNPSKLGGKSPTIKKLTQWLNILELNSVSFSNIYDGYGSFSLKDVKKDYLNEICPKYDKVLALGVKVSNVLDLIGVSHFTLPHPSGLNRQLNDRGYVENALTECKKYVWGNA